MNCDFQQISLLLVTNKVEETKRFYESIFSKYELFNNRFFSMAIMSNKNAQAGFLITNSNQLNTEYNIEDPDGRLIYFSCGDERFQFLKIPSFFIPILKSSSIEKTKHFYEQYATCVAEQHGTGPRHYSIHWTGPFSEIYPQRNNKIETMEFIFNTIDLEDTLKNVKSEIGFKNILSENNRVFIIDPNGFRIKMLFDE